VKSVRKTGFYPRLAGQSIRKNGKFYLPYLLTCIGTAAMFYIMLFLNGNEGLQAMRGSEYVKTVLFLGALVVAIFSVILLFYTNSFLMRRRKKELGLYNILGMEKRHIVRILAWETIYTALIGIAGGLLTGILLSKLLLLLLCSLLKFDVPFGFSVSLQAIFLTAVVYSAVFALNLLVNGWRVGRSKPIELLYAGNTAEREPKTKWVLTAVGLLTLGAGYAIALAVRSPLSALSLFFVAVLLVIAGTYCLFTAGSIAALKLLRRNKTYYYQTKHFTTVSGMLHRMKRNAAGLASICILSTMVLVTVSSTLCLYLGAEDALDSRYPHDISVTYYDPSDDTVSKAQSVIREAADEQGAELTGLSTALSLEFSVRVEGDTFLREPSYDMRDAGVAIVYIITEAEYTAATGKEPALENGEVLAQAVQTAVPLPESFRIADRSFAVRESITDFPQTGEISAYVAQMYWLVVGEDDLLDLAKRLRVEESGMDGLATQTPLKTRICIDLNGDSESQKAFYFRIQNDLAEKVSGEYVDADGVTRTYTYNVLYAECRAQDAADFYAMYGGFFFLGIFLGLLFLMATVLIIYYKQISEGYEDAERFRIMRQVGMSEAEVWRSIKSQILTVFFLPLAMAALHISAAFPMITRLLRIFNLQNIGLFAWCTLGTVLVFALIYGYVYALTARAYYQIVKT
jgi:putative ABC transport system permease protein